MAETWNVLCHTRAWAATTIMAGIWNDGTNVLRVKRIGITNTGTAAVTGTMSIGEIRRYYGMSSWTPTTTNLVTTAHDSANAALSSVTSGYAGTITSTGYETVKYFAFGNEEVAVGSATLGGLCSMPYVGIVWDAGYGDTETENLTLRTDEAIVIYNVSGAVGTCDVWIEFTNAAT